ncbi:uncharacterized protein LOC127856398 isoform X2 [Dreissena polymorpha]|uniref:uncharacterized protein LOC127856398 isoform X2 n=1 Tax=Dreissena polymorpha TaxID=45954 RepID=UPI002264BBA3|nr:uncharacterized protein LOC127856398 isoform X2 [Dreissena polymorpha]
MPPATALQFFRKRQTIDNLVMERPQSLTIFRECVRKALIAIERRIEMLQQSYYGPQKNLEREIKRWLGPLSIVLNEFRISYLLCRTQLDDVVYKKKRSEGDPTLIVDFNKDAAKIVLDIVERVCDYLKTGFGDIIKDLKMIAEYMFKYCRSFSDTEGDSYLETAVNYERQRKEFSQAIHFNLDDIVNMAEQFETKGMRVHELGFVARNLAEKCNATHAPFLVIIPQAFENLKNAVAGIRRWLDADEVYADFIKYDIDELEKKRETQEKDTREMQVKCSNSDHKVKTAKRLLADITAEVKSFENRETILMKERIDAQAQIKDVVDLVEIKTFRREEVKHRSEEMTGYELENFKLLEREIVDLNDRKPVLVKKLDDINRKLDMIAERRETMNKREQEVSNAKSEVKKVKRDFRQREVELERLDFNLGRLKEILRYKTSPEVLKKIFHGMPLTARHVANKGKRPIMVKV